MEIPVKKLKNGFEIPIFGIGTWMMGGDLFHNPDNDDKADIKAIRIAIELGVTHIDTSEVYANGYAEALISKAIKGINRKELFIVTKVWPLNLHYDDLIKSANRSLNRLKTDYIDLFLIHFPNPRIPIEESISAMDYLVDKNLVRFIGLSNFNTEQFIEAQKNSRHKIVVNQVHYNLIHREYEKNGFLDYSKSNDVMLIAWRPIQEGLLAKKGIEILDKMCKKYNKTHSQIAIKWLISQNNVVTLAKSRNIEHLKENLGVIDWVMEMEDIELLKNTFPNQKLYSDSKNADIYKVIT